MKSSTTLSSGQNTVKPVWTFEVKVSSAPALDNKSAKFLQPCLVIKVVKFTSVGPAAGASAAGEIMAWLICRTAIL